MKDLAMMAHPILEAIRAHIMSNFAEYITLASALAIATIVKMPPQIPKSLQDWWTWMRDSLQTAVPAARAAQEAHSTTVVTTPTSSTKQEASAVKVVEPIPPTEPVAPAIPKEGE